MERRGESILCDYVHSGAMESSGPSITHTALRGMGVERDGGVDAVDGWAEGGGGGFRAVILNWWATSVASGLQFRF